MADLASSTSAAQLTLTAHLLPVGLVINAIGRAALLAVSVRHLGLAEVRPALFVVSSVGFISPNATALASAN